MKLPAIITKFPFGIGVMTGAVLMLIITASLKNPLNANISEEDLDVRSNSVIKTQQAELQRLRAELRSVTNSSSENSTNQSSVSSTANSTSSVIQCATHNDCAAIDMVCENNTCKKLNDPSCACMLGLAGEYVLCVSDGGSGKQARTVSCGENKCEDDPFPRCTSN